jgi:hypothetical protein
MSKMDGYGDILPWYKDNQTVIYLLCFLLMNFIYLFIMLCQFLHKYKHKNIQTINQSMAGYMLQLTPITAALTERT